MTGKVRDDRIWAEANVFLLGGQRLLTSVLAKRGYLSVLTVADRDYIAVSVSHQYFSRST